MQPFSTARGGGRGSLLFERYDGSDNGHPDGNDNWEHPGQAAHAAPQFGHILCQRTQCLHDLTKSHALRLHQLLDVSSADSSLTLVWTGIGFGDWMVQTEKLQGQKRSLIGHRDGFRSQI